MKIEGLEQLTQKFDNMEQFSKWAVPPMTESVAIIHQYIAEYPPKPAHSTYIRTTILGKRWTTKVQVMANRIKGIVGNKTVYAPWVQSAVQQVDFHKATGWRTDEEAVEQTQDRVESRWKKAIDALLNR